MVRQNRHYAKLLDDLDDKKDSIFEPCRIIDFSTSKFTATVYGMRSNQTKENVLVLFPSLFLNSGIISFPVQNSTGILFIGADNENYLFPAQFLPPTREVTNGVNKNNAGPGQYDQVLSLEHMEPGEQLIRSLTGSYIFVRNSGEIELATSKLHRLALNEMDGSLETTVEKERSVVGNFQMYNGPYESLTEEGDEAYKNRHHIKMSFSENVPKWDTEEVLTEQDLQRIIDSKNPVDILEETGVSPTFEMQLSNVFSEVDDTPLTSIVDGEELFLDFKIHKDNQMRLHTSISKAGAVNIVAQSETGDSSASFEFSDKKVGMSLEHGDNQYTMELRDEGFSVKSQGAGSAELLLTPDGDLEVTLDGEQHSFKALMKRVNELSLLNQLEKI